MQVQKVLIKTSVLKKCSWWTPNKDQLFLWTHLRSILLLKPYTAIYIYFATNSNPIQSQQKEWFQKKNEPNGLVLRSKSCRKTCGMTPKRLCNFIDLERFCKEEQDQITKSRRIRLVDCCSNIIFRIVNTINNIN